jgi:hypothetical protein
MKTSDKVLVFCHIRGTASDRDENYSWQLGTFVAQYPALDCDRRIDVKMDDGGFYRGCHPDFVREAEGKDA